MAVTYEPIATQTLGSSSATVTFSSIPSTYTDLVLVINASVPTSIIGIGLRFNSDTNTNYSTTILYGDGSSAASVRNSNSTQTTVAAIGTVSSNSIVQIMNYSNATTNKTAIGRDNTANSITSARVGLWRSTAAINAISISPTDSQSFNSGSTFTLYGIKAA